ncbi:MAG: NAD-dependent epimerase/dehydratase family protein [Desulfobacteraceae bacterium]|nr:MAG: NAD-dependent epimerase/dehydratase family protein [Desulfobacteraceae bacterium]
MNYLITGGAGFIGSHLAEALLVRGAYVAIIDDLSTGSILNIDHLKSNPNFHYVLDTVMHREVLMEMVDRADVIVHLAAAVGVRLIVESPVRTIETNIKGTELVLELASKKKRKVIIASTSEVYGKASKVPFCEDDDLVMGATNKGRWSYACSKMIDEFLALAYWKEKQVPTVVVRLFNTVGPRQTGQYGMVVPRFIGQARRGEPLTVYGDGNQRRCFTWVGDVVQAIIDLSVHPGAIGDIFNLGNTEEVTILDLAKRVKALIGSSSQIEFVPYEQAYAAGFEDMPRRVPSIEKVSRLIGYRPTLGLDGILKSVNEYFEQTPT